jgi:Asp-tRNA(Asn)/Glu-tRNA(Gln) amidotransferase B subunit
MVGWVDARRDHGELLFVHLRDWTGITQIVFNADHADAVENCRNGKKEAAGFLIGQVMRASKGKANPKLLRQMLDTKLAGETSGQAGDARV